MNRRHFLIKTAASMAAAAGSLRAQTPRSTGLDRLIPTWLTELGVPGTAVALIESGRIASVRGYGVLKAGDSRPVTADTVFEAASLSKPVFAYLVMKLAESGAIDLDMPIGSFFRVPDFRDDDRVDAITARIVLAHQTGLANWRPAREPDRFRFQPGSGFSYSGEAYVRLQRFVEHRMKTEFNTLISTRLFDPWKLTSASYVWRPQYLETAAEGHDRNVRPVRTRLWQYSPEREPGPPLPPGVAGPPMIAVPNAAASLYCSVHDYARYVVSLMSPPPADAAHLSRAGVDRMLTPQSTVNGELAWGLGWGLTHASRGLWHWGNNGPYQCFVTASRDTGTGVVVFTNSANGLLLCRRIVAAVVGEEHPAFRWERVLRP